MSVSMLLKESQNLRKNSQGFLNKSLHSDKPVIVTWGLMNAGKSSLLNIMGEDAWVLLVWRAMASSR